MGVGLDIASVKFSAFLTRFLQAVFKYETLDDRLDCCDTIVCDGWSVPDCGSEAGW